MQKATVAPHPFDPKIKCGNCAYWHPAFVKNFVIDPNTGQSTPADTALKNGVAAGKLFQKCSMCFVNPTWVLIGEDMYCGNFQDKNSIRLVSYEEQPMTQEKAEELTRRST